MDLDSWPLAAFGPRSFEGKTAIVTGASSGIGRTASLGLTRLGAQVVCAARGVAQLEQAVEGIRAEGGQAIPVRADCSIEDDVRTMVDVAMTTFGRVDLAFNNAGTEGDSLIADADVAQFDRVIGLNLRGTFLCMKYETRAMLSGGRGAPS